jgi:predicted acetyltransferase
MTATASGIAIRELDLRSEKPALFTEIARLLVDAYPIMHVDSADAFDRFVISLRESENYAEARWAVAERDGALAGVMRLYDYEMNLRGRDALAGGLGSLGVSALHKRRGVAGALIAWYLDDYRRRGAAFGVLYPFRLDFYRKLGFGYGTPVHRYRFAPGELRDDGARGTPRILGEADAEALIAFHERMRATTSGLFKRHRVPALRALRDPELRLVGIEDGGELRGLMQVKAIAGPDPVRNRDELLVRDLLAEDDGYAAALRGYLRAQRDQFARIVIEAQDAALYLAAADPSDDSNVAVAVPAGHRVAETGLGMMYRILDVERAFAHLPPSRDALVVQVRIDDPTLGATAGDWTFRFDARAAPRRDEAAAPDATLSIGIHDLSSVVAGSLRLRDVVRHGIATVEPRERAAAVDAAFAADRPPICTTRF